MITEKDTVPASAGPLRPLFRWPGGKRWLVPRLLKLVPEAYGRYFEPFVGGGAMFFALRPAKARLGDKNSDLINAYRSIRDDSGKVAQLLRSMLRTEKHYYQVRAQQPTDDFERAARTIYLTTLAFNGIHRVNREGAFNVPYGRRDYPELGSEALLRSYGQALKDTELESGDFEHTLRDAVAGDLVYLDPPYTVAHSNNGFLKYNARIFVPADQQRLADTARELVWRGCHVIVTNASHQSIDDLYPGFERVEVRRQSVMAASRNHRKEVTEYLFTSASKEG